MKFDDDDDDDDDDDGGGDILSSARHKQIDPINLYSYLKPGT